ncbi:MAG TPA: AAA family ATPase, partial [Solirubrobacteraceae bacterium]
MIEAWPFVGRRRELNRLGTLLDAGRGAVILGPAGVGKSSLLHAVMTDREARGERVVLLEPRGTAADYLAATPAPTPAPSAAESRMPALVVVVDDADHLGEGAAASLMDAIGADRAVVLAAARGLDGVPSALLRLWHDGRLELLELGPLPRDDVDEVVETVLGGQLDGRAMEALAERARGNALLLREMMSAAVDDGLFVERDGLWRMIGTPAPPAGVGELVRRRLDALPPGLRAAFDLLATGEPVPLDVAGAVVGEAVLEQLEAEHWVALRKSADGESIVAAHPVYGEIARAALPELRRRRLQLLLARELDSAADARPSDLVRATVWRLEAGEAGDPTRLLASARAAISFSLDLAERIARHVAETAPSLEAALLLADVLTLRNKTDEAEAVLAGLPSEELSPADREAAVHSRALGQGFLGGDPEAGIALVDAALNGDLASSTRLQAIHAAMLAFGCRFAEALAAAAPVLAEPPGDGSARAAGYAEAATLAVMGASGASYWLGRFDAAIELGERWWPVARECRATLPYGPPSVEIMHIGALLERGDLNLAESSATAMLSRADDEDDPFARPRSRYLLGKVALARGRPRTAARLLRASAGEVRDLDLASLAHVRSVLARACAEAGLADEARAALALPDGVPPVLDVYRPEWELAEAAISAAEGLGARAAERALWVAEATAAREQWGAALVAAHEAARWGQPAEALPTLRSAAERADGPLPACYLAHVEAQVAQDAPALEHVSAR